MNCLRCPRCWSRIKLVSNLADTGRQPRAVIELAKGPYYTDAEWLIRMDEELSDEKMSEEVRESILKARDLAVIDSYPDEDEREISHLSTPAFVECG
jgi:hypothetical protein